MSDSEIDIFRVLQSKANRLPLSDPEMQATLRNYRVLSDLNRKTLPARKVTCEPVLAFKAQMLA